MAYAGSKQNRHGPEDGPLFYSDIFHKVAGAPQIDISKLEEGFCAKTAIFMFHRNFYLRHFWYHENPPARLLGASFLQWVFKHTPSILKEAPQPKRLTVVKRKGRRRIVNGNEFLQKARALGWQAEVGIGGVYGSCC